MRTDEEKKNGAQLMSNFLPTDDRPILITSSAVWAARIELEEYGEDGDFLRVTVSPKETFSPQYCLDFESKLRPGDVEMNFDGLTVVVGRESADRLRGTVIDYVELPDSPGFKFHNPNAKK